MIIEVHKEHNNLHLLDDSMIMRDINYRLTGLVRHRGRLPRIISFLSNFSHFLFCFYFEIILGIAGTILGIAELKKDRSSLN